MRCRGVNVLTSTCPARTAVSSSSRRAKRGTRFSTSGRHAMNHLVAGTNALNLPETVTHGISKGCHSGITVRVLLWGRVRARRIECGMLRLAVHMRALRGISVVRGWLFHDFHLKTHWQIFRRITGGIVASLVPQNAMHYIFSRKHSVQRMHPDGNSKVSAIHTQFLVRRKRECHVDARRVPNSSQDN